jgi:hypothetical protein
VGETITIEGINFGSTGTVKFKTVALSSGSITSWSDTKIVVTLPSGLPQGEGRLQVSTASGTSRGAYFAHGKAASLVGHVLLPRYGATSAQVGTDVWIFGGFTNWGQTGLVERYNLASNYSVMDSRWMMPTPVYLAGAAAIGSKIYLVGGYDNDSGESKATLQIFDTANRTWSSGADAPVVFYGPVVVSYGGKLYVFGGANGGPYNPPYVYDPASNNWTSLPSMPAPTYAAAAAPIGTTGKILVMGGYSSSWVEQASTQEYDTVANSWTPGSNMKKPRAGGAGINNGNKVFCLHGETKDNGYLADGEWYGSGTWRDVIFGSQGLFTPLPGRYHDKIFILSGSDEEWYSSNVWRFISP